VIGSARQRVRLEAKVLTPDGGGGFSEAWEAYAVVWADITPAGGGERVEAGRLEPRVTHRVTIRRRGDVSANHRVVWGARMLAIRAVLDAGPQEAWTTLLCEEGAPS